MAKRFSRLEYDDFVGKVRIIETYWCNLRTVDCLVRLIVIIWDMKWVLRVYIFQVRNQHSQIFQN